MDFVERLFHLSPDGGNGMTEWSLVLVIVCVTAIFAARVVSARSHSSRVRRRTRRFTAE